MIDFSSLGGGGFPLSPTGGAVVVVVEGLDLDWRVDSWPNGNIGLLWMGPHSYPTTEGAKLCRV